MAATGLTSKNKIGLVLTALLGLVSIVSLPFLPESEPGEAGPPTAILVLGALLGVIMIAGAYVGWRTGSRGAIRLACGVNIFSGITAIPAFFVEDVAAGWVLAAAVGIAATVVSVVLTLSPAQRAVPVLD